MADSLPNGNANGADVEMKEEAAPEVANMSSIQPSDPTDPQPPPQPSAVPAQAEHLSTIQPMAAPTPPGVSGASVRPGSMPPAPSSRPEKPVAHGGPTRQFLNHNLTPHLLEGMKYIAVHEPEKPLMWLSGFLRDRSKEVEG